VSEKQDKLAGLRNRYLERDDEFDPEGRVYRDKATGEIFHSVTRILSATMPEENKKALEKWLERSDSAQTRDMAASRGTSAHNNLEYVTKTASRLARSTANKRGVWRSGPDGLFRAPEGITTWALEKAIQGAPRVPWSASGFARGLRGFCVDYVTAIHSTEFSIHHAEGFAGTCDLLADTKTPFKDTPLLTVLDWKTTGKSIHASMGHMIHQYSDQLGAYSLGLKARADITVEAGALVIARRSGEPQQVWLNRDELDQAETNFLERCTRYFDALHERLQAQKKEAEAS
jgi:hypothetical protein